MNETCSNCESEQDKVREYAEAVASWAGEITHTVSADAEGCQECFALIALADHPPDGTSARAEVIALRAALAALLKWMESYDEPICHCGAPIKGHRWTDGHSPVELAHPSVQAARAHLRKPVDPRWAAVCPECGTEHPSVECRCLRGDPDCDHATMNCPLPARDEFTAAEIDDLPFE